MKHFKPLSDAEKSTALKIMRRDHSAIWLHADRVLHKATVAYRFDGNFTWAFLRINGDLYLGYAKRNPQDNYSETVGRELALARAVRSAPLSMKD